jgi:hypothetical protein
METAKQVLTNLSVSKSQITCEVCGNEYDKCFEVLMDGKSHIFDSFECAIHALAPKCANCGISIIGHGMEASGSFFCCAHCASKHGIHNLEDRADHGIPATRDNSS